MEEKKKGPDLKVSDRIKIDFLPELQKLLASDAFKISDFSNLSANLSNILDRAATLGDWSKQFASIYGSPIADTSRAVRSAGAVSPEMESQSSPFERYSYVVKSWEDLLSVIEVISNKHGHLGLVWRGQANSKWGLHSSLYRRLLLDRKQTDLSHRIPRKAIDLPGEEDMVNAEDLILDTARHRWRQDGTSGLELLATLQHLGAPTRLIDVTRNPMVAAWFAVSEPFGESQVSADGRIFVMGTIPQSRDEQLFKHQSKIELDEFWSRSRPPWMDFTDELRRTVKWGTGELRRVWFPPAYVERISAQNAGFVLDGIPIWTEKTASTFKKSTGKSQSYWGRNDILYSGSIYARYYGHTRVVPISAKRQWAATFTFVIPAGLKQDFKQRLETQFGITIEALFPDNYALAATLKNQDFSGL